MTKTVLVHHSGYAFECDLDLYEGTTPAGGPDPSEMVIEAIRCEEGELTDDEITVLEEDRSFMAKLEEAAFV